MTITLIVLVSILAAIQAPQPIVASPGSAILIDTGPTGTTFTMTLAEYQRFVEERGKLNPDFVAIVKTPDSFSPRAQYGINLALRRKILSWAIDGDETDGYVLFADWNGNGDLRDESPMRFERIDGKPTLRVERQERDSDGTYPVSMKLVLDWVVPPTKTEKRLALKIYNRTTRSGLLSTAGGATVAYRLTGSAGFYAESFHMVAFDLDSDGEFNPETEVFRIPEKYVNIGDTSYEFAVAAHGSSLTLTPLAEHRSGRAALTVGAVAPDFAFTDLDGKSRKLSDYRGKLVLLDFWGVWCPPCVAEAPKLVAAYEKYHDRGLEILGLDTIDTREKVLAFMETHHFRWTQTMEPDKGPIQTLYRVHSWPSYFLIAPDGTISLAAIGSDIDLERELSARIGPAR